MSASVIQRVQDTAVFSFAADDDDYPDEADACDGCDDDEFGVTDDQREVDRMFPPHTSWSVYVDNERRAVAANRVAAMYAALVTVDADESVTFLRVVGPSAVNEQQDGVGVTLDLYRTVVDSARHRTELDYYIQRIRGAADDLAALHSDVNNAAIEAERVTQSLETLRQVSPLVQLRDIATWNLRRFETATFRVLAPAGYLLFNRDGSPLW